MRCARLIDVGRVEVGKAAFDDGPGELVRMTHVGICGSDLHTYRHGGIGDARATFPFVMGHEGVGRTEDGRRVALEPTIHCGVCSQCERGNVNLCLDHRFLSLPPDQGMLRESLSHPSHLLVDVPERLSDAAAVLLEPLSVAIHAFDLLKYSGGSPIAILGCGSMGMLCVLLARQMGAPSILCTDVLDYRCAMATDFGATVAVSPSRAEGSYEYLIEASGDSGAHQDMLRLAAPGAKIAVIGTPWDGKMSLDGHAPRRKGLTLYMVRRSRNTLRRAADMDLPLDRLVTHVFPFERAQEAFDTASGYRDGCLKVVIAL